MMSSPIADGVLAATHRLVQQALSGQWNEVPKTVEERRVLLDRLSSGASPQDHQWLSALQQAMAESDALVAAITPAPDRSPSAVMGRSPNAASAPVQSSTAEVDLVMNMIRGSK
jgi:hypothetical protein